MGNAARCNKCGDVIVSTHRHDFVSCTCGAITLDGGEDYRRCMGNPIDFVDVTEDEEENARRLRRIRADAERLQEAARERPEGDNTPSPT